MKLALVLLVCSVALAITGCATSKTSRLDRDANQSAVTDNTPSLDLITYHWSRIKEGEIVLEVAFSASGDSMGVRDGWSIYERRFRPGHVWDISVSRCSKEECVQIIDQSLTKFRKENPNVWLTVAYLDMHIIRELWGEILAGARQEMTKLPGTMVVDRGGEGDFPLDTPPEIGDEIERVLEKSPTITAIKEVLGKHGMNVRTVFTCNSLMFNDSLRGQKWSDIAKLLGIGIELPGVVEFEIDHHSGGFREDSGGNPHIQGGNSPQPIPLKNPPTDFLR